MQVFLPPGQQSRLWSNSLIFKGNTLRFNPKIVVFAVDLDGIILNSMFIYWDITTAVTETISSISILQYKIMSSI